MPQAQAETLEKKVGEEERAMGMALDLAMNENAEEEEQWFKKQPIEAGTLYIRCIYPRITIMNGCIMCKWMSLLSQK